MTEPPTEAPAEDAVARRLAHLQARRSPRPPGAPSAQHHAPSATTHGATGPAPTPPGGGRRSLLRRRRHRAAGARRIATGVGAAGTLGLVAAMALGQAQTPAPSPTPAPVATVGPVTSSSSSDPASILPRGQGQPTTTAAPASSAPTQGTTRGSG